MLVVEQLSAMEMPPRVRRRAPLRVAAFARRGNTSACAEKSCVSLPRAGLARKYLRVCGEEKYMERPTRSAGEIPPRVRRRDGGPVLIARAVGNTSACAEKRVPPLCSIITRRKYLRVCGEEWTGHQRRPPVGEIPPRVRRRGNHRRPYGSGFGNTSACAEKSRNQTVLVAGFGKYLRVCGEE